MPANRVPVIVNAVTPIVSDTQGMVTVVAIPLSPYASLVRLCFVVTDITPLRRVVPGRWRLTCAPKNQPLEHTPLNV